MKKKTSLSRTSVKKYEKWKRIKAVQAFEDNHDEFRCAGKTSKKRRALGDRFRKSRSVEKYVRQDEKDFTLDVPLQPQNSLFYGFENKGNIQNNRFFHHTIRQPKKVLVSASITWKTVRKLLQSRFLCTIMVWKSITKHIKNIKKKTKLGFLFNIVTITLCQYCLRFLEEKVGQKVS